MRVVVGNALEFHSGEIGSIPIARSILWGRSSVSRWKQEILQ